MFEFRVISMPDGNQVIDTTLKTPCESLTPLQMMEYMEVDSHMAILERMKRKQRRETGKHRKQARNPLWKLAGFCGIMM